MVDWELLGSHSRHQGVLTRKLVHFNSYLIRKLKKQKKVSYVTCNINELHQTFISFFLRRKQKSCYCLGQSWTNWTFDGFLIVLGRLIVYVWPLIILLFSDLLSLINYVSFVVTVTYAAAFSIVVRTGWIDVAFVVLRWVRMLDVFAHCWSGSGTMKLNRIKCIFNRGYNYNPDLYVKET